MAEPKLPAWLVHLVDQRLALITQHLSDLPADPTMLVMTPLREAPPNSTTAEFQRWDRSCDMCGRYCPDDFYTGHLQRELKDGRPVILTFGVCPQHRV